VSDAVLAIRLRALGDVVLTTPALRALHLGYGDAPIDVLTDARYAPLLEGLPGVDRVIPLGPGVRGSVDAVRAFRPRYAVTVDFFGNPRSAWLAAASRAPRRFGFDVRGRRIAYTDLVPRNVDLGTGRREYAAATSLRLAVAAGGRDDGVATELRPNPAARAIADRLLATAGVRTPSRALGLVAAGTWPTKTWPAAHAARFARALTERGWEVIVLAGPGEEHVTGVLRRHAPLALVLPPCDVAALVAVIARLGGVVGTDSGPRHVAAALGVPTFAWFGPTNPDNWTPPGAEHRVWWTSLPCRGCNRTACPHWNCMPSLDPEHAAEMAAAHFTRHVPAADLRPAARA
jgi:ADP-heptose:LPS heptosyltransferase